MHHSTDYGFSIEGQLPEGRPAIRLGQRLPNGATVIAFRREERGSGLQPGGVVLCARDVEFRPYVTWAFNDPCDTYWGHYHESLAEAVADFEKRGRE